MFSTAGGPSPHKGCFAAPRGLAAPFDPRDELFESLPGRVGQSRSATPLRRRAKQLTCCWWAGLACRFKSRDVWFVIPTAPARIGFTKPGPSEKFVTLREKSGRIKR